MFKIEPFVFSDAVRFFWATRDRQVADQLRRGGSDQGARGAVTGGQQMDGFIQKIIELMTDAGVKPEHIYTRKRHLHLPGFFRPTKQWDLLVVENGNLQAALELKSQVGSFGNNFNNRTEEAVGSAADIWTAYRDGAFSLSPQPWLGYLFLLEDCAKSRRPVSVYEPHFPVFDEFKGASYAKRYELFCRKLVRERKYTAACFLTSDRNRVQQRDIYLRPASNFFRKRASRFSQVWASIDGSI